MKKFYGKKLTKLSIACALISISTLAIAADFNLPFVSAAALGNAFSGWAATADDASTEYANPAGLVKINNQQIVLSGIGIFNNSHFTGTTTTPPFPGVPSQIGTASDITHGILPSFYYAAPLSDRVVFGFGETIPFGLGANYAKTSVVRYSATTASILDVDIGPSIGVKITDQLSLGLGLDADRLAFQLNNMVGPPFAVPDAESQNSTSGWGFGWHGGALYQFTPATRVGFNYFSPVAIHTSGNSALFLGGAGGELRATNAYINTALPARAELSGYHDLTKRVAVMGTIFYTNWGALNQLTTHNQMLPSGATTTLVLPLNYHNTFDYAAGLNFKATDKWLLRTGFQLLTTPTNNRNRLVADPIGGGTGVNIGAHYQQNHYLGYDVGYSHVFFQQTKYNNVTPPITSVFGYSNSNTNIVGAQITWNLT